MTSLRTITSFIVATLLGAMTLDAQTRAAGTQPQFKGVFEPVSFSEDINFTQVYFVNADVGWVAGEKGTIIRTIDGGKTWEAQLGGDPADNSEKIRVLHFLDERRGWAIQDLKTLRTRDGESWEEIGTAPHVATAMAFTSPTTGFLIASTSIYEREPNAIFRTTDGGRSWKPVFTCSVKVSISGLNKNVKCDMGQIQFPTPSVGYVVTKASCVGMGCSGPPLIAKTTDGGENWQVITGPGVIETDKVTGIFFLDENTGFARLASEKLHMTSDGGKTWRGIVASPGETIRFADPSVGWGVKLDYNELKLSFTTDGGRRWGSREIGMPATVRGFSLPRRDRGYVVGDNGMIFRYRIIPASQPMVANAIAAPAMPTFESSVDEQVAQLEDVLQDLAKELESAAALAPGASSGVTPAGATASGNPDPAAAAAADSIAVWSEPFESPLPAATGFAANCCKKSGGRLDAMLGALALTLPDFVGKYKNLNLLLAALRMGNEMPDEYRALKAGLRTFRRAQDKASAQAALQEVLTAIAALKQTTKVSMQQELPPAPSGGDQVFEAADAGASSAQPSMSKGAAGETKNAVADSAKAAGKDAVKAATDKAKAGLGSILRKKIP